MVTFVECGRVCVVCVFKNRPHVQISAHSTVIVVCESRKMVTCDVISMAAAHQPCRESGVFTDYTR